MCNFGSNTQLDTQESYTLLTRSHFSNFVFFALSLKVTVVPHACLLRCHIPVYYSKVWAADNVDKNRLPLYLSIHPSLPFHSHLLPKSPLLLHPPWVDCKINANNNNNMENNDTKDQNLELFRTRGKKSSETNGIQSSFSIILSSNSMNSLNWVYRDVFLKYTGHHNIKCKVLEQIDWNYGMILTTRSVPVQSIENIDRKQ